MEQMYPSELMEEGRGYKNRDVEIIEERRPETRVVDQTQIDDKILTPKESSRTIFVSVPKMINKSIALVLKDEQGERIEVDGQVLYEVRKFPVFEKWVKKKIVLPVPEFHSRDVVTANMSDDDIRLFRIITTTVSQLQSRMINEGKDFSTTIAELHFDLLAIINSGKGRLGETVRKIKTLSSETRNWTTDRHEQELIERKSKGGAFGKIFGA